MRSITIDQFLTVGQINQAIGLWNACGSNRTQFHRLVLDRVLIPNMKEIDAKLGQENSPEYLAYMLEHVFTQATRR